MAVAVRHLDPPAIPSRAAVAALRTASETIDDKAVWHDRDALAIFDKLHSRAQDGEVSL